MDMKSGKTCFVLALAAVLTLGGLRGDARAQALPGNRAAGMADAFVAVADDGSAVYWNPAGLVVGPFFTLHVDFGRLGSEPDGEVDQLAGARSSATFAAVSVPPLGLSYYRLRSTTASAPGTAEQSQLDRQTEERTLQTLVTHHIGVTVLQSIGEWLTVGATAKAVVGSAGSGLATATPRRIGDWLDVADRLDTSRDVRADVDVGAMVDAGRIRAGFTARNLAEPEFGDRAAGLPAAKLKREARVGLAWGSGWPSGTTRVVVAADADLTRRVQGTEERRDVAAGVETWWRNRRLGLRTGVRASTLGDARPVMTGGASAAIKSGTFVDGYAAFGDADTRGWGLGFRVVF